MLDKHLAVEWGRRILEEFQLQATLEANAGLPLTTVASGDLETTMKGQHFFAAKVGLRVFQVSGVQAEVVGLTFRAAFVLCVPRRWFLPMRRVEFYPACTGNVSVPQRQTQMTFFGSFAFWIGSLVVQALRRSLSVWSCTYSSADACV